MKNFIYKSFLVLLCLCMALTIVSCSEEEAKEEKKEISYKTGIKYQPLSTDAETGMDLVATAGDYELLYDNESCTVAVRVKSTGYIWKTNMDQQQVDETVSNTNVAVESLDEYRSQLKLTYYNSANDDVTYDSYGYGVKDGNYKLYGLKSGLRIVYDIGQNIDDQLVPKILTQKDYEALSKQMGEDKFFDFSMYYDEYVYDELEDVTRDAFELEYTNFKKGTTFYQLASSSKVVKIEIYKNCLKGIGMNFDKLQAFYSNAGYSYTQPDAPRFTVAMDYTITDKGLKVDVPVDKIDYATASYRLYQLQVLPHFGTVTDGSPATVFVPDGSGALVDAYVKATQGSSWPCYGADNSLFTDKNKQNSENAKIMQQATLPVYGIANGNDAFVSYITEGEGIGIIECHPADLAKQQPYLRVGGSFVLRPYEKFNSSGATSGTNMLKFASQTYQDHIVLDYLFVTGEKVDYVDMAKKVRSHIFGNSKQTIADDNVRFYLETYGVVKRKDNFLGYAYNSDVALTELEQAKSMYNNLNKAGITNIAVRYKNWYNDEYINKLSNIGEVDSVIGDNSGMTDFVTYVNDRGGMVYPNVEVVMEEMSSSLSDATWHSKFVDGTMVNYSNAPLYSTGVTTTLERLVVKSDTIVKDLPGILDDVSEFNFKGMALSTVGDQLFSDFTEDEVKYRNKVEDDMVSVLKQVKDSGKSILVDRGNAYALPYVSDVMNISLGCSSMDFEQAQVPFLQIVLHGKVSYAGGSLNLADNYEMQLLRSVEYGANVAYTLNYAESDMVKNTNYTELYSTNYQHWIKTAKADYKRVAAVLDGCQNVAIEDHTTLAKGVFMTTYANGVQIVVNYNDADYTYQGTVIGAKDFARVSA